MLRAHLEIPTREEAGFRPAHCGKAAPSWLKPDREAALKRAFPVRAPSNPPAEAGGKEEPAKAG